MSALYQIVYCADKKILQLGVNRNGPALEHVAAIFSVGLKSQSRLLASSSDQFPVHVTTRSGMKLI